MRVLFFCYSPVLTYPPSSFPITLLAEPSPTHLFRNNQSIPPALKSTLPSFFIPSFYRSRPVNSPPPFQGSSGESQLDLPNFPSTVSPQNYSASFFFSHWEATSAPRCHSMKPPPNTPTHLVPKSFGSHSDPYP